MQKKCSVYKKREARLGAFVGAKTEGNACHQKMNRENQISGQGSVGKPIKHRQPIHKAAYRDLLRELQTLADVSNIAEKSQQYCYRTLFSIYSERRVREHKSKKAPGFRSTVEALYRDGEEQENTMVDIASKTAFHVPGGGGPVLYSACCIARTVLETAWHLRKEHITAFLREPHVFGLDLEHPQAATAIRKQVQAAVLHDELFSPAANLIKDTIGREHEYKLEEYLRNLEIPFISEEELNTRGEAKTPDVRLLVPVEVKGQGGVWQKVSWIDSKAMFGDPEKHLENNKEQLVSYEKEYGPGLVIYWFNFVEDINFGLQDVLVMNHFPDRSEIRVEGCQEEPQVQVAPFSFEV
eukprot:g41596.t1